MRNREATARWLPKNLSQNQSKGEHDHEAPIQKDWT